MALTSGKFQIPVDLKFSRRNGKPPKCINLTKTKNKQTKKSFFNLVYNDCKSLPANGGVLT